MSFVKAFLPERAYEANLMKIVFCPLIERRLVNALYRRL